MDTNNEQTQSNEGRSPDVGTSAWFCEEPKAMYHHWRIRKELKDGMFTACDYNGPVPVTAATVAAAPSVQRWLAGDRIDEIYHPKPSMQNKLSSATPEKNV